ncbi:MAG: hypothetical protein AAGF45_02470 [Pseudomonadota bacterium]
MLLAFAPAMRAAFFPIAAAFIALAFTHDIAGASAWTLERGQTRTYVTSSFTYGDHGFDDDGKLVKVPEYRKFTLEGALEYGVRDWLTGIVRAELRDEYSFGEIYRARVADPIFDPNQPNPRIFYDWRTQTFASAAAGARVRLWHTGRFVASLQGLASTGGFDSTGARAQSDGALVEARAEMGAGHQALGRHFFANASAGYRMRLEADDKDELLLDLTLGAKVLPRWMLIGQTFTTADVDGTSHHTKVGLSIVHRFSDRIELELGGIATVLGKNTIQEFGGKLGVWWSFP